MFSFVRYNIASIQYYTYNEEIILSSAPAPSSASVESYNRPAGPAYHLTSLTGEVYRDSI